MTTTPQGGKVPVKGHVMKLVYFAWVKTTIGKAEEELTPPASVRDVAGLLSWLKEQGPTYAQALAQPQRLRVAVNQDYARLETAVAAGDEVALFPPVTGG